MANRQAISDLFSDYAWAMDANDFDLLRQVFHEDASFTINIAGADPVGPIEPGAAIVDFISGTVQGQDDQRRHVITNLRYERESDAEVHVSATLTLNVIAGGSLTVQSTGVYRVEIILDDGSWQFREFSLDLDLPF